jgi:glycine betaine/proline transport system permease protein
VAAPAVPFLVRRREQARSSGSLRWILLGVAAAALYVLFRGQWTLPHEGDTAVFRGLNGARDQIAEIQRTVPAVSFVLDGIRGAMGGLVDLILGVLVGVGWPAVIAIGTTIGYAAGGWRTGLLALSGLAVLGALRLWEPAIETLAVTLAAVVVSVVLGVALGILAAKSHRFGAVITPVLDVMQIMPQVAYLIPFVLFFGIGPAASAIVTLVYAMPAAIRITALGIRDVPATTVEAARSLGATGGQLLRKVELPLARRTIGLAINQTIMLALSMVVITVLIDGPGLGVNIIRAVQTLNVGAIFDAGLAIVVLAVILDRVTEQASRRMDPHELSSGDNERRRTMRRRLVLGILGAISLIAIAANVVAPDVTTDFPRSLAVLSFRQPVNEIVGWIKENLFFLTDTFKEGFTAVIVNPLEGILTSAPVWLVIGLATLVGLFVSGLRAAIVVAVCLLAIVGLQLWEHSMETLATVLVATAITLAIGALLGILAASSDRFSRGLRPFLDAAQTMPAFVYLLPALALFEASRFTAIVAAVIFAIPPVVRLVETGIRLVPKTVIEAGLAAGATRLQLLRKIELPVARPALLLATNQGIIMVLGMVVLGGLVGAGALGFDVVNGFAQRRDFGRGLAAGICIVLLGIALDRMSQGAGRRRTIESPQDVVLTTVAAPAEAAA